MEPIIMLEQLSMQADSKTQKSSWKTYTKGLGAPTTQCLAPLIQQHVASNDFTQTPNTRTAQSRRRQDDVIGMEPAGFGIQTLVLSYSRLDR